MGDVLPFGLMDDQIPKWHDEDYAAREQWKPNDIVKVK